ncbi:MAG: DUF58 domain-containing protein [Methylohalobius sp. ZOD2]|nr:hypothetical protein [Methylothermaceae bacterium]
MEEFHYRIRWRARSAHPGHHRSQTIGGGYEFRGHAALLSHPDPRHLDVHATLLDPFGEYKVRQFAQTSTIPVFAVADLSASLGIGNKPRLLSRITTAIAYSAFRTGDPFGFFGVNDEVMLRFPLRFHKGLALELHQRLGQIQFQGKSRGLNRIGSHLGKRQALIFLISDFHFPLTDTRAILDHLQPHDVVPVVLWQKWEWQPPARWGWTRLYDPETGRDRPLWLTPRSEARLTARFRRHREDLTALCRQYGRPPFFVEETFQPEQFSHYFLETCA